MRRRLPLPAAIAIAAAALAAAVSSVALLAVPRPAAPPQSTAVATEPVPTPGASSSPGATTALRTAAPYAPSMVDRPGIAARLQAALDAGRVTLAAPGLVASVLFPDGRQWTGTSGVADLATGRALAPDTPFAVASVSKTFLAAEILLLVDEDRLSLDESAARLLPTTLVGGAALDSAITVRMLLDHTSGLRDYLVDSTLDLAVRADPRTVWTPGQALAYAGSPVAPPGAGYHYANTNYVLLGLIAEHVTGRTLAQEYRARFFEPLGLRSASYQGVEPPVAELPTAYRYGSARLDAVPEDVTDGSDIRPFTAITTAAGAAGSVAASARDLARWARALYDGHVLPARLVDLMVRDADATLALDPPYPYGLGVQVLMVDGRVSYGHSGRLVGMRSTMRWFPDEGVAIAVVSNQSRFDPGFLVRDLLAIVAPQAIGGGWRPD